jgi:hypothetical protein
MGRQTGHTSSCLPGTRIILHGVLLLLQVAVIITPHQVRKGNRGLVIVGGSMQLGDVAGAATGEAQLGDLMGTAAGQVGEGVADLTSTPGLGGCRGGADINPSVVRRVVVACGARMAVGGVAHTA